MVNLSALNRFGARESRAEANWVDSESLEDKEQGSAGVDAWEDPAETATPVHESGQDAFIQALEMEEEISISSSGNDGRDSYQHPGLEEMEEQVGGLPSFMGQAWRSIAEEEKVEAWVWLRDWVDWFTFTYQIKKNQITNCWYKHTDAVEMLWAMANAESKAWAEGTGTPTNMPLTSWQNFIPGCVSQLSVMLKRCAAENQHKEENIWTEGEHPYIRSFDEQDWQNHISGAMRTLESPGAGTWRAAVLGHDGQTLALSAEFQVPESVTPVSAGLGDMFHGYRGDSEPTAFVRVWGEDAQVLQWQKKNEETGVWTSSFEHEVPGSVLSEGTVSADLTESLDEELKPAVGP